MEKAKVYFCKERAPITDGKVDWASDEMDLDVASELGFGTREYELIEVK